MKNTHKWLYSASLIAIALPALVLAQNTATNCPLIRTYMNFGRADNRPDQVMALQSFLKSSEGFDVDVTGQFDEKTDVAVRNFQKKYADTVLVPWGGTKDSGYVYITTAKKINEIACKQTVSLHGSDLTAIQNFKAKYGDTGYLRTDSNPQLSKATAVPEGQIRNSDVSQPEINSSTTEDQNPSISFTADVGNSVASRFWTFIKNMFR